MDFTPLQVNCSLIPLFPQLVLAEGLGVWATDKDNLSSCFQNIGCCRALQVCAGKFNVPAVVSVWEHAAAIISFQFESSLADGALALVTTKGPGGIACQILSIPQLNWPLGR